MTQHGSVVIEHLNEDKASEPAQPLTIGQHDDSAACRLVSRLERLRLHRYSVSERRRNRAPRATREIGPPAQKRLGHPLASNRVKENPSAKGFQRVSIPNWSPRLQGGCSAYQVPAMPRWKSLPVHRAFGLLRTRPTRIPVRGGSLTCWEFLC